MLPVWGCSYSRVLFKGGGGLSVKSSSPARIDLKDAETRMSCRGAHACQGTTVIFLSDFSWRPGSCAGLISPPFGGRRSRDAQLFFVNRRPVDPPKRIAKLINATPTWVKGLASEPEMP